MSPSDPREAARASLEESARAVAATGTLLDVVAEAARRIGDALSAGGKIIVFGNGGSAADAQHFAAELLGRFTRERGAPLAAIAVSADSAVLTALANDFAFADVFARQVQALARPGDVVLGISTSGASENVLRGIAAAPPGALTIALTGTRGALAEAASLAIRAPVEGTAAQQAAHIAVLHAICAALDARFADHT